MRRRPGRVCGEQGLRTSSSNVSLRKHVTGRGEKEDAGSKRVIVDRNEYMGAGRCRWSMAEVDGDGR